MPRFLSPLLALVAVFLTGCQPKDPLDWKIDARSPDAFEVWLERHQQLLPPDLRLNFNRACGYLRADTATHLGSTRSEIIARQFCQRVDGKTIRALLLDAGEVEINAARLRILSLLDNVTRNIKRSESLPDAATEKLFADKLAEQEAAVQTLRARIAEIEAQARQLSGIH